MVSWPEEPAGRLTLAEGIGGGSAWPLASNALATGLELVLNIVLAQVLLPDQVGTFFLA